MTTRNFFAVFIGMNSPFLIWAAHFGVVYGINGLACARGLDAMRIFGFPLVPLAVVVATVAALLLTGLVLLRALGGQGPAADAARDPREFARWFTMFAAGSALVAILWVGLPALQVPSCG